MDMLVYELEAEPFFDPEQPSGGLTAANDNRSGSALQGPMPRLV
jgi:hypothetical protein